MKKFDKSKYDKEYRKELLSSKKSQFNVDIDKTEKEELEKLLKKKKMTKTAFLRNAIKRFSDSINYSYNNEELIDELKRDIDEFGEDHKCILVYKVIDDRIFFTNYDFIVEEDPFDPNKELDDDEKYIVTDFKYALEVFEEQNKLFH